MIKIDVLCFSGVFMIRLYLLNSKGKVLNSGFKSAILKYKSLPIRLINVIAFWPFYAFNLMDESQYISVEVISDFIDNLDYIGEAHRAKIIIEGMFGFENFSIQKWIRTKLLIVCFFF